MSLSDFFGSGLGVEAEGAGEGISGIIANLGAITGGAWKSGAIFCLGIMPYITASIIFSLLQKIVPSLERMAKEGEAGQQRINQYTRYVTVGLCLIHSLFIFYKILPSTMWVGERDVFGFLAVLLRGNGGRAVDDVDRREDYGIRHRQRHIAADYGGYHRAHAHRGAGSVQGLFLRPGKGSPQTGILVVTGLIVVFILIVMGVVLITQGTRRITIQQAKHVRGTKIYGGQRSYMPLRVNHAGVMPVIFASPVMMLVSGVIGGTIAGWGTVGSFFGVSLASGNVLYTVLEIGLIFFFSYFWTALYFNPADTAKNIKEYGSFVPGIRAGQEHRGLSRKRL